MAAAAIAVVLLGLVLLGGYWQAGRGKEIDSLAVLPFSNEGAAADMEYLSDGITESLIDSLSRLPRLRVMARSTVFRFKDRRADPRSVGSDLRVRVVLTGTVAQRGDRLVVGMELVDVADGSRLWGEQYDRKLSDLYALPADLATAVSQRLRLRLSGKEQKRLSKRYTENTEAYQLYMIGRYHMNKLNTEGWKKGIEYFNRAIEKDPHYALAYTGLADVYLVLADGELPQTEAMPKAKAAAEKALELDDTLAEAHGMPDDFAVLAMVELRRRVRQDFNLHTSHISLPI